MACKTGLLTVTLSIKMVVWPFNCNIIDQNGGRVTLYINKRSSLCDNSDKHQEVVLHTISLTFQVQADNPDGLFRILSKSFRFRPQL